jgi:preflagellin peptidase FlaK
VPFLITELKLLLIACVLAVASYQDIRTREIDDRIWLVAGGLGGLLTLFEIITTPDYPLVLAGFSIFITAVIALAIFYTGLYGGADAKALIAIALALPILPFSYPIMSPIYPLTIFGNALLLSILLVPLNAVLNLLLVAKGNKLFEGIKATRLQKFGAFFTGTKVSPLMAMSVHFNLLEKVSDNGERRLKLFTRVEDVDEPKIMPKGATKVWVTPAIPMIVFFLIGFLISIVGIDIIFRIVGFMFGAF